MNIINIANILSLFRLFSVPAILWMILEDNLQIAFWIFLFASITDIFDGFFARKFDATSSFGTFLDPIADKFLVLSAFFSFLFVPILSPVISIWMLLIILCRDLLITGLKILFSYMGQKIRTSKFAKFKTAFQMLSVYLILIYILIHKSKFLIHLEYYNISLILYLVMLLTTLLTFTSGLRYFMKNYYQIYLLFRKEVFKQP